MTQRFRLTITTIRRQTILSKDLEHPDTPSGIIQETAPAQLSASEYLESSTTYSNRNEVNGAAAGNADLNTSKDENI
jgi:hypothetical protein